MSSLQYLLVLVLITWMSMWIWLADGLELPNAISSNMVLQRAPQSATVWGWAGAGSVVTLTLDGIPFKTFADDTGNWMYSFPPHNASTGNTLVINGDSTTITLSNLAFGDVFLCGGQSNMQFTVSLSFDAATAIPDSINYPHLRFYVVAQKSSNTTLNDTQTLIGDKSQWVVSQPKYVGGPDWQYLSATCYYFGRSLYRSLNNGTSPSNVIPIGLLESCYGGTIVEAWTSPAGLAVCGPTSSPAKLPNDDFNQFNWIPDQLKADPNPNTPSVLWNAMIFPLLRMKFTGATWYQGESNEGNATNYACRFPAMINDWRLQFNNPKLYFYFVLLAAYKEGNDWADLRRAQLQALQLPFTGVASAQDLGDEKSPEGGVHPRNKTIVGERLSLNAQRDIYGQNIVKVGPATSDVVWPLPSKGGLQTTILRFATGAINNQGLHLADTSQCDVCCAGASPFVVQTNTGALLNATVTVDSASSLVLATVDLGLTSDFVTGIAHDWLNFPECALYNSMNLPHLPVNISRVTFD